MLDSLRARIRDETCTRDGPKGNKRIHTDFLISLRLVLTLERLCSKYKLTPMFPIFYPDMEELVGKTFRDAWDILGLGELYDHQVGMYLKAKGEGIGQMKRSRQPIGAKKYSRGGCCTRKQDKEFDRLLTGKPWTIFGVFSWRPKRGYIRS